MRLKIGGAILSQNRNYEVIFTKSYGYLTTNFYKDFNCKCGDCRRCCCVGWNVAISMKEYYKLMGLKASSSLKNRLDRAFFTPHDADPERFALLNHNYLGECPLRDESGLCALQREKGEKSLPLVCQKYPRSVRPELGEAALSNSCEGVVELLEKLNEPIKFEEIYLPIAVTGRETPERLSVRKKSIEIIQNRGKALRDRLVDLGSYLGHKEKFSSPYEIRLNCILELCKIYAEISPSLSEYCKKAVSSLENCPESKFFELEKALDSRFPNNVTTLENLLVNHFFYEKFPYSDKNENEEEEYISLCGLYSFLRILGVGNADELQTPDAISDLSSATFRVTEHTAFNGNAELVLKSNGFTDAAISSSLLDF